MATILVVDDDQRLLNMLRRTLAYEGYHVVTAIDGRAALNEVRKQRPDLIVLDWLMPEVSGVDVVARLRAADDDVPVLMLTARDTVEDRVAGLDSGADDYLVKPFAPAELLARIRAMLRRTQRDTQNKPLTYADLVLDAVTRTTRRGEREFHLTPTEFDLLEYLLQHPRQVLTRERLLQHVWGYDFEGNANVLEVYVGYLRRKTEAGGEPRLIQTVRGVGYVLRAE